MSTSGMACASDAPNASPMRSPRSAPRCACSATPKSCAQRAKKGWLSSGAHHSSTGPTAEPSAVASAWRARLACSSAAPAAPSSGTRRVFTSPATGALAKTAMRTRSGRGALDVIAACETARIGAQRVGEAQSPPEEDRAREPVALPAPARRDDALAQARRGTHSPQRLAKRHVLHQRDLGKAVHRLEGSAAREERLDAGGDAGEARARVNQ